MKDFVIGIPIYENVDLLDFAAPKEIFSWMAKLSQEYQIKVYLIAETNEPLRTLDGLRVIPDKTYQQVETLNLLWVPGANPEALKTMMSNRPYLNFLQRISQKADYITSVCTGAILLAYAGLLNGYKATTHWQFIPCLKQFPEVKIADGYPRYVIDGNRVTGGGVSSGLEQSLKLVEIIAGRDISIKVQQLIQYFPEAPVGNIPGSKECPLTFE